MKDKVYDIRAVRLDGLTFVDCVAAASVNRELVTQFDRLNGTNLAMRGSPIEVLIDKSSGRLDAECAKFLEFVWEFVFLRVPAIDDPGHAGGSAD